MPAVVARGWRGSRVDVDWNSRLLVGVDTGCRGTGDVDWNSRLLGQGANPSFGMESRLEMGMNAIPALGTDTGDFMGSRGDAELCAIPGMGMETGLAASWRADADRSGSSVAPQPALASAGGACSAFMCAKMLISPIEAAALVQDSKFAQELKTLTGTAVTLSDSFYPGSQLHEMNLQGGSFDGVLSGTTLIIQRIVEFLGFMSSGDENVEMNGARVKLIVPAKAAAGVIGAGGRNISIIQTQTGVRINIDSNFIPTGKTGKEQAILLSGEWSSVCLALPSVLAEVSKLSSERWFQRWACHSSVGTVVPGLVILDRRGKGKSRGMP